MREKWGKEIKPSWSLYFEIEVSLIFFCAHFLSVWNLRDISNKRQCSNKNNTNHFFIFLMCKYFVAWHLLLLTLCDNLQWWLHSMLKQTAHVNRVNLNKMKEKKQRNHKYWILFFFFNSSILPGILVMPNVITFFFVSQKTSARRHPWC